MVPARIVFVQNVRGCFLKKNLFVSLQNYSKVPIFFIFERSFVKIRKIQ